MEEIDWTNTRAVLEQYANAVQEKYKNNLIAGDRVASGNLVNSIKCYVNAGTDRISVEMRLEEYYKQIEDGRGPTRNNGSGILFPAIKNWIRFKRIVPRPNADGTIPTENQYAYAITKKIHREGYQGGHYLQKTMEEVNGQFIKDIEDALSKDIEDNLTVIMNTYFN